MISRSFAASECVCGWQWRLPALTSTVKRSIRSLTTEAIEEDAGGSEAAADALATKPSYRGENKKEKKAYREEFEELRRTFYAQWKAQQLSLEHEKRLEKERLDREHATRKELKAKHRTDNQARLAKELDLWKERRAEIAKFKDLRSIALRHRVNRQRAALIVKLDHESSQWITPENMDKVINEELFLREAFDARNMFPSSTRENSMFNLNVSDVKIGMGNPFTRPFSLKGMNDLADSSLDDDDLFALNPISRMKKK